MLCFIKDKCVHYQKNNVVGLFLLGVALSLI